MSELATEAEALTADALARGHGKLAAYAGITFAGLMVGNVLSYAFYAVMSRVLGVEHFGVFSSLFAIVLVVSSPATIGQMVVAKLASELVFDPMRLAGLVRAIDRATIAVSLAGGAGLAALAVPLASFLHVEDRALLVLTGASLCGAIALPVLRGVLQGTSAFGRFALSNVAENAGKILFAPVFALFGGLRGALCGLALGYAAAAAFTFLSGMPHRRAQPIAISLAGMLRASLPTAIAILCINLLLLYDVILAKRYFDDHAVGLYGAAALAGRALYAVIVFVPTVLLPQISARVAVGRPTGPLLAQAFGLSVLIAGVALGGAALMPRQIVVAIAGRQFAGAATYIMPYVYAIAMLSLANVVVTYNIARDRMLFVVPLAAVTVGEIVVVVLRHAAASQLLQTIVVGHTLALLAAGTALGRRRDRPPSAS